jgi:hypothetical protein
MITTKEKKKKIVYCDDKRYVCPFCGTDVDSDAQFHCKDNIVPIWYGCYCCDDLKCCEEKCTCGYQYLTDDDTYGYLP